MVTSEVMFTCCCTEGIEVNNIKPLADLNFDTLTIWLLNWMSDGLNDSSCMCLIWCHQGKINKNIKIKK